MIGPRPRTAAVRAMASAKDSAIAGSAGRAPVIPACAAVAAATNASTWAWTAGSSAIGEGSALMGECMVMAW